MTKKNSSSARLLRRSPATPVQKACKWLLLLLSRSAWVVLRALTGIRQPFTQRLERPNRAISYRGARSLYRASVFSPVCLAERTQCLQTELIVSPLSSIEEYLNYCSFAERCLCNVFTFVYRFSLVQIAFQVIAVARRGEPCRSRPYSLASPKLFGPPLLLLWFLFGQTNSDARRTSHTRLQTVEMIQRPTEVLIDSRSTMQYA